MAWVVAWIAFAIFIAIGCASTVGHPILYGLFASTVVVGLLRLFYGFYRGIIDDIFGKL